MMRYTSVIRRATDADYRRLMVIKENLGIDGAQRWRAQVVILENLILSRENEERYSLAMSGRYAGADRWTDIRRHDEKLARRIAKRLNVSGAMGLWVRIVATRAMKAARTLGGQYALKQRQKALYEKGVENVEGRMLKHRGHVILATGYRPEEGKRPVLIECLGVSYRISVAEAEARGIPVGVSRQLTKSEVLELRTLKRVVRWAVNAGVMSPRTSARRGDRESDDRPATIGRKPTGKRKLSDLVQYRHGKVDDETHLAWSHMLAQERAERTIKVPQFSTVVVERSHIGLHAVSGEPLPKFDFEPVRWLESGEYLGEVTRAAGRDSADVPSDDCDTNVGWFPEHEGYEGVKPLWEASKDENAKWLRPRYRLDDSRIWISRFRGDAGHSRQWVELPWVRDWYGNIKPDFLNSDGSLAENGKSYFQLRSAFKAGGEKIAYWEKRFSPATSIQTVEPIRIKDPAELAVLMRNPAPYVGLYQDKKGAFWALGVLAADQHDVASIMGDKRFRGRAQLAWKGGHMVFDDSPQEKGKKKTWWRMSPPDDTSSLGEEALGMIRGAIESGEVDIAIRATDDYALGQEVWEEVPSLDGKTTFRAHTELHSECSGCVRYWGLKDSVKWVMKTHAWVCPRCGTERARLRGHVWVDADLLPFLPMKHRLTVLARLHGPCEEGQAQLGCVEVPAATHVEVEIYGSWLGELVRRHGYKVGESPRALRTSTSRGPAPRLGSEKTEVVEVRQPKWVGDLLEADSKSAAWFWAEFKKSVIERHVWAPARKAKAEQAVVEHAEALALSARYTLGRKYGELCMLPL